MNDKTKPVPEELQAEEFFPNLKEIREECKKRASCTDGYICPYYKESSDFNGCIAKWLVRVPPEKWDFRQLHGRMLRLRRCKTNDKAKPAPEELQAEDFFPNLKEIREECKKHVECTHGYICPYYKESSYLSCIVRSSLRHSPRKWNFRQLHGRMLRLRSLKAKRKEQ